MSKHTSLVGFEDEIKEAIESPEWGMIFADAGRENRAIYYGQRKGRRRRVKVVVEFIPPKKAVS